MNKYINLLLVIILSSCASFRGRSTNEFSYFPKEILNYNKKVNAKISLKKFSYTSNGLPVSKSDRLQTKKYVKSVLRKLLGESKFLKSTKKQKYQVSLDFSFSKGEAFSSKSRLASWLTLFLYPSRSETTYTATCKFIQNGEVLGEIIKTDKITTWRQTFMVFAMPFQYPASEERELIQSLYRSIIIEGFNENFIL